MKNTHRIGLAALVLLLFLYGSILQRSQQAGFDAHKSLTHEQMKAILTKGD